ncbi:MAG: carboxypeptidase-like regulatory domain-containing protein [Tamlana sp.]
MIKKTITYFSVFFSLLSFSQDYNVVGSLVDVSNQPIAYANIVLIKENSSLALGTTSDEKGYFLLNNLSTGNYVLKISFLGFVEYSKNIEVSNQLNLGTIILEESLQELNGVTIVKNNTPPKIASAITYFFVFI